MARYGSDDVAFLLVDGYSILGVQTKLADNKESLLEDTTALGDSWEEHSYVGLRRAELSQEGFFDDEAGGVNAALSEQQGTERVLCYGVAGNTLGKGFVGFRGAMQVNYQRVASRGELHKANAKYQGSGAVDEGVILHAHGAESSATGNTEASSHDNAASSANGGSGYLQVSALALGGYTDVIVKLRHSADNVTFADLATFTAVTAAPDAERVAVAGTINRYTACSWAFSGAGAGQSVTFLAGVSRD